MTPKRITARRLARGMTLVEMMVAITIGMFIVAAMAVLFANNSRTRSETDRAAQKVENGRYAVDLISADLAHAGYYAVMDPSKLTAPTAMPDMCATSLASIKAAMPVYVQGVDNATTSSLSCLGTSSYLKANTDVIMIRRSATTCVGTASGCSGTASLGGYYGFQASSCSSNSSTVELGVSASSADGQWYVISSTYPTDFTLHQRVATGSADCSAGTTAPVYTLIYRIYYVATCDVCTGSNADTIPTLKRIDLTSTGFSSPVSLVQGVENLQIEYGVDSNTDGNPDAYTASPEVYYDYPGTISVAQNIANWQSVVSVKLFVLARNIDTSPGHGDGKTYSLGYNATKAGTTRSENTVTTTTSDAYKRGVYQETVRLQNPSSRRFSPS